MPPMKIYTRTGDDGRTGLIGGRRVPKSDLAIDCYGTVDELNAAIGLAAVAGVAPQALAPKLKAVQDDLPIHPGLTGRLSPADAVQSHRKAQKTAGNPRIIFFAGLIP